MKTNHLLRLAKTAGFGSLFLGLCATADANSGAWLFTPANDDWNTPANWSSNSVPNSPSDIASFDTSSVTGISLSAPVTLAGIVFNPGASSFTITCPSGESLEVGLSGIDNQSAVTQTFVTSGGLLKFSGTSRAGKSNLVAENGGTIEFSDQAMGGQASVQLMSGGVLKIDGPGSFSTRETAIGSLEGDGVVISGKGLEVGRNNADTTFSGVIQSGNLIKTGTGTLTLTGANTYDRTTVRSGTLMVNNTTGSGTGRRRIAVAQGTLAGTGTIAGEVNIGDGVSGGAFLSPGVNGIGTLRMRLFLSFGSDATYNCELDTNTGHIDMVAAQQVSISSSAQFNLIVLGNQTLPVGTVLTVIDDRTPIPCGRCIGGSNIHGNFGNLLDNSVITAGNNNFQVSYEGGNGNDLTLTVVQ